MNSPKVSIIVPIFGVEDYLRQCVDSLLGQTYKNLEILLVDDGSTDSCPEICDSYALQDSRICVLHKTNGGISDARNYAIDRASGDYLYFVDGDDYIHSETVEVFVRTIQETGADMACCGRYIVNDDGEVLSTKYTSGQVKEYSPQEAIGQLLRAEELEEATWDKFYKKSLFDGIRFPGGEINEDIIVIPLIMEKCNKIVHTGRALYYYRRNMKGVSKQSYNEKKTVFIKHIEFLSKYVLERYPELRQDVYLFQGRYAFSQLRSFCNDTKLIARFHTDYLQYKKYFKKAFLIMLRQRYISKKDKIQMFMVRFHLYTVYLAMKKSCQQ